MIQYVKRNIAQLNDLLITAKERAKEGIPTLPAWKLSQIEERLLVSYDILKQQTQMATTKGRHVANRIVSFHWKECRPIVRGKEGKRVEFGPKAHIAQVDGFVFLDTVSYESFHEGVQLKSCLSKHDDRFGHPPHLILADQLYANRENRKYLHEQSIDHSFRLVGRPPDETPEQRRKRKFDFKKKQGARNHIEATFGHLKTRFNLDKITWRVPDGMAMQIHMGLIAFNLSTALAKT